MANITLSIPQNVRSQMDSYAEIRWSEVARNAILAKMDELRKLELLRKYIDKEPFAESDLEWMDEHDWHPVDERKVKPSFVKSLAASRKEKSTPTTISALFK